jgi:hypothetical protein
MPADGQGVGRGMQRGKGVAGRAVLPHRWSSMEGVSAAGCGGGGGCVEAHVSRCFTSAGEVT